jgi:hypothetical protein
MKLFYLITSASIVLASCQSGDKKQEPAQEPASTELSFEQKNHILQDSANYTTIQWIDSTTQNIGKVNEGRIVEVTYRFKNTGTKPLVITEATASCGCTVPEKPEQPIAPGTEGVIKAKFDSNGQHHGEARKTVFVTANTNPQMNYLYFNLEVTE